MRFLLNVGLVAHRRTTANFSAFVMRNSYAFCGRGVIFKRETEGVGLLPRNRKTLKINERSRR